jgi:hypothetical protein
MAYLDLAELPEVLDRVPLWSARRPAPAWFRRSDYREVDHDGPVRSSRTCAPSGTCSTR